MKLPVGILTLLAVVVGVVGVVIFTGAARGDGHGSRSLHDVTLDVLGSEPIFAKSHGIDCSFLKGPGRVVLCTHPEEPKTAYLFRVGADGKTRLVGGIK
jgi:hypothetical protein